MAAVQEEKVFLSWKSEERLYKKRNKEFFSTVMVMAVLAGIIFFFIEGIMPVLVIAAIVFVVFVSSKTEPGEVEYSIGNKGISIAGEKYVWEELVMFWMEDKWGRKMVNVITQRKWPSQLALILPKEGVKESEVKKIMSKYMLMEKPVDTRVDKMARWLQEKVPLEE